jgi:hypothetical protein
VQGFYDYFCICFSIIKKEKEIYLSLPSKTTKTMEKKVRKKIMDEHGSKAMYIGVSIIITMVIIGVVFGIYQAAHKMAASGTSDAEKLTGQMSEEKFMQYDGESIQGDQIFAIIKQLQSEEVSVAVNNGTATHYYLYEASGAGTSGEASLGKQVKSSDEATQIQEAQVKSKTEFYISPTRHFTCTVCRDKSTDAITALYFEPTKTE